MKYIFFLFTLSLLFTARPASALDPKKEYEFTPDMFGLKYEEHKIPSTNGAELMAWYFPPPDRSTNLMIISDDGNGNMADNLDIVAQFQSLGYGVLTYDYRGYGKSSDFKIVNKLYIYPQFADDLNAVCDYAKRNMTLHFSLYGVGIGGGLSIGVGMDRRETQYLIGDSPYPTLEYMKNKLQEEKEMNVMIPPVFNKNYEPKYALETKELPRLLKGVLIIVGENDKIVGPDMAKDLQKLQKKMVEVYIAEAADSENTFSSNNNKYFVAIKEFMDSNP
ncbi:MAG: alpha/beta hydrolase [Bacteroidia bacterium]